MADYVLAIDGGHLQAGRLKATALTEPGERQISAIARHYYLSAAQYLLERTFATVTGLPRGAYSVPTVPGEQTSRRWR